MSWERRYRRMMPDCVRDGSTRTTFTGARGGAAGSGAAGGGRSTVPLFSPTGTVTVVGGPGRTDVVGLVQVAAAGQGDSRGGTRVSSCRGVCKVPSARTTSAID